MITISDHNIYNQKQLLNSVIDAVCNDPASFVRNPGKDFIRGRKLPLKTMIKIILSMQGGSINTEIFDFNEDTGTFTSAFTKKKDKRLPSAPAFVQQRDKILPSVFYEIFKRYNSISTDIKKYKGYRLLAADGSSVNIAYNPNAETYIAGKSSDDKGYNQFHINAIYDILNKTYFDCIIQPKQKCNEPGACTQMVKANTFDKSILIADRGYGALNLLETINRTNNLEYLFRIKNDWLTEIKELPMKELDTEISFELRTTQTKEDKELYSQGKAKWISGISKFGKYKKSTTWEYESPFRMTLRIVRFKISDDTYETIVTSLDKDAFPLKVIKELYHLRWGIETSFRELKYAVGLVNFHCKKEDFILQEIYARLILYNFCMRIATQVIIEQDCGNKWEYQINYTMAIHICRAYFRNYDNEPPPEIAQCIKRYKLPVRPDRRDKRKIKPKSAVYFLYRVA